jgi:hypothetical protein
MSKDKFLIEKDDEKIMLSAFEYFIKVIEIEAVISEWIFREELVWTVFVLSWLTANGKVFKRLIIQYLVGHMMITGLQGW